MSVNKRWEDPFGNVDSVQRLTQRSVFCTSLCGLPVEWNYVQLCTCKPLQGHFPPHATLSCFLGLNLFLVKNTDGTLELMCSGLNGPWTLSPFANPLPPQKKGGGNSSFSSLQTVLSLCIWKTQWFTFYPCQGLISEIRSSVPACLLILMVKVKAVPYCDSTGGHPNGHMDTGWEAVKAIAISTFPYKCYAQLISGTSRCLGFSQTKVATDWISRWRHLVMSFIQRCLSIRKSQLFHGDC